MYAKIVEKELHALVTLTGWTHGHIAEVIAAVGSGPSPVVVFNWLGWAGLMCMREAVHFTIVGLHALSPRQKLECEAIRERVAVVSCYQPAQGHWSHPKTSRTWARTDFNLPAAEEHFIFFFAGSTNRILEYIFFMWLDIVHRVVGSCLLLLSRPKGMRTRIKKWIAKYIATAHPDFDASRVLFRPFQNKAHFCGLLQAMLEDGAGACLDSVEPIALHTSAGDVFGNGGAVLTYFCDNGFHQRVVTELHGEYGTQQHCVAKNRAEFPDLCVRFALDKPLQRAMRNYLLRVNEERVQSAKLARQLLQVFDQGVAMFMQAGRDYKKLQDIDVTDALPPIQLFAKSPEFAALAAEESGPDGAKRKALLDQLRAAKLEERMEPHALQILKELQRKGLTLLSVVGAGAFSIAISAIAEQTINPSVPAGTRVALKLSREGVQVGHIKNHSLARESINTILLGTRLARKDFGDIIPAPVYLWDSAKTGRCFWGHTAAEKEGCCLIFECVELIDKCFGEVIKPFGEQWMRQGVLGEGFQDKVLRPLFQAMFELQHTAGLAAMDLKPANMGRRANGRCVLWDLGHSVVYSLSDASERQTNALPVALSRNATLAIGTDGQTVKAKGRRLLGRRDGSGLFLVSNQQASEYCRALTAKGKGWGRVARGTPGYADRELKVHKGAKLEAAVAYAYDMFAGGRSILKLMTHDRSKQRLDAWEESARQAAAAGEAGIQRMLVEAVDPSPRTQIAQGIMVARLASLIAGLLHPDPMERMGAHRAMLHAANTLPFLSPQYSLALEDGTGIVIPGGLVESLAVPYREFPALEGKSLPPIVLLPQPDMGLGAQLRRALQKGEEAAVYGGKLILTTDTAALRNACPSRYSVSVKGVKGFEAFICDAAQTPERPFKWFVDNSVAGPFMNGRDGVGYDVNCDLDRASAWQDSAGCVWFVLRANRDIAEGEWLMWKYNWMAGAGIATPGLTFAFD
jgi:serine/threonine protein kinase